MRFAFVTLVLAAIAPAAFAAPVASDWADLHAHVDSLENQYQDIVANVFGNIVRRELSARAVPQHVQARGWEQIQARGWKDAVDKASRDTSQPLGQIVKDFTDAVANYKA